MPETLTLYTAKICPYAQRTEIALAEAKADFIAYQIDLQNKPEWYQPKVNPASKVPAVAYGGPKVPPEQPSPESAKLAESLIIVEFVADLYPESKLLPKDPVQRARARFFIDVVTNKLVPGWYAAMVRGESFDAIFAGIEAVQDLLPAEGKGKYAVGDEFTIADVAVAPFLGRLNLTLREDIGKYGPGLAKPAYEKLQSDPKYARFWKYWQDIKERDSFKKTFDEDYIRTSLVKRFSRIQE